ncbi:MAG TPA: hypothetical protein VNC15_03370, partial [Solirubrobacterales bacterium]|nr:hypothetical protein [Solirubrobacterales bacterium]
MLPVEEFRGKPPEFWAVVKLVSQVIGYSHRATRGVISRPRAYAPAEVVTALRSRGLSPEGQEVLAREIARYSMVRADLMQNQIRDNLMDREEARELFEQLRAEVE